MLIKKRIVINENGHPIGDSHHKARLSDDQVEQIREIYDEGKMGYSNLAKMFNTSRNTIKDICKYRRRNSFATNYKTIYCDNEGQKVNPEAALYKL